ncbi:Endonuclease/exonuclease/phosphatase [Lineolata rhizophorae]|uniref:Endonuclease/exonuclease/phosphatase n=1 Tax=Lineolata rhizophorae TaxID=578093 RepID=A0A6A6P018_9PEZI|nr:Endonuclease/exonuclease/phosphatase [Lineolata rhizophorae]
MPEPGLSPTTLRIVSLNCWGLKYISKVRAPRLREIGRQLAIASPPPDIVGLQECWTQEDYHAIRAETAKVLPYAKFYHSGIFGGGLVILSRWPFEEASMVAYPLNGRPAAFYRGDWFVGKGVACARIRWGKGRRGVVEVFCTHLHAPYEPEPYDSYLCHRTAQAWHISKLVQHARERGHLALALGDFNMRASSLAHDLIAAHTGAVDVWSVLHPDAALGSSVDAIERARGRPVPTAKVARDRDGATCDSVLNTWRWNKGNRQRLKRGEEVHVSEDEPDPKAKRLDYVFVGGPLGGREKAGGSVDEDGVEEEDWTVVDANVGMMMRHPSIKCSLSDHFSVEATLELRPRKQGVAGVEGKNQPSSSSSPADSAIKPNTSPFPLPSLLPSTTYASILTLTRTYTERERRQRRLRLSHCALQLLITISCLVAVWWAPHNGVAFALMFVSSLGMAAGVLDGLMGGLFVGSELRALREFDWEVRTAKEMAERQESAYGEGTRSLMTESGKSAR